MASSRKSSRSSGSGHAAKDLADRVAANLEDEGGITGHLTVALSGGIDSVVLLDCLQRNARRLRYRLSALHVNHQLSPNAARWSAFCLRLCRARGIPFKSVKAQVRAIRGSGLEAEARAARYGAFARQDSDYIVLAHHRDDQVETFLLQLLRGAGVKGLAAMPVLRMAEGGGRMADGKPGKAGRTSSLIPHPSSLRILRPLLDVTREEILAYARKRKLKWMEDESNADTRFSRNYLRHEVLPAIARRFPAYRAAFARAAGHIAEAHQVLDEVAAADGKGCLRDGTLGVEGLRALPSARARNLLRYFLAGKGAAMPSTLRLEEALRQMLAAKRDAQVAVEVEGAVLRRFDGRIHLVKAMRTPQSQLRRWRGERRLELRELGGVLTMARHAGWGISLARLRGQPVTIRVRRGGERLQPDCRRPRRSLKNLLQEARMPPWQRERLPLLFHGGTLVWAAGVGVDCAYQAHSGEPALAPHWSG